MNVQLQIRQAILDRRTYEPPGGEGVPTSCGSISTRTPRVARLGRFGAAAWETHTPQLLSMYPEYDRSTRRRSLGISVSSA